MNSSKISLILKIINSQKEKLYMFSDCGRIWDLGLCDLSHKVLKSRALFSSVLESVVVIPAKMLGPCINYDTPNDAVSFMCPVIRWLPCAWPYFWVQSEPNRHDSCLGVFMVRDYTDQRMEL